MADNNNNNTIQVAVRALPQVGYAAAIATTTDSTLTLQAKSSNDWDLLQRHADWLESPDGLLGQISLVYPHQALVLALPDGAEARVSVVLTNAAANTKPKKNAEGNLLDASQCAWPEEKEEDTTHSDCHDGYPPCRRIVANTEIIVSPPSVSDTADANETVANFTLQPARQDYSPDALGFHHELLLMTSEEEETTGVVVRPMASCPPGTALLHPDDHVRVVATATVFPSSAPAGAARYVRVEHKTTTHPADAGDDEFLSSHLVRLEESGEVEQGHVGKSSYCRHRVQYCSSRSRGLSRRNKNHANTDRSDE
jgi:hypothetical protein